MTTRLKGVVVLFEQDIREDDAEKILEAIRCLRNVADVRPVEAGIGDWMAAERARQELGLKLLEVLRKPPGKGDGNG